MKKIAPLIPLITLLTACASGPVTTQQSSTPQVISQNPNLAIFVNEKYSYKFSYPSTAYVYPNNDPFIDSVINAPNVSVFQAKDGNFFNVNVYQNFEKDLKKHVEKMWNINKDDRDENDKVRNKNLSNIETTNVNNREAYEFTSEDSYADGIKSGYVLNEQNTYVFAEYNGFVYEIHSPSMNQNSKNILSSFEFFDPKTAPQNNWRTNIDNCKNNYANEKDQCLLTYAKNQVFHLGKDKDSSTCRIITENTSEQNECYWLFAMKSKENAICRYITDVTKDDYMTKQNCEKEISYKNADVEWKLEDGYPPYYDEEPLLYFGKGELTGWLEQKPNDKYSYFNITPESKNNLPPYMQRFTKFRIEYCEPSKCYLNSIPATALSRFSGSSQTNPIKISTAQLSQNARKLDEEQNKIPAFMLSDEK